MSETMSREEYLAAGAKPKRGNKFGAKRTVVDAITFDSKRETEVYGDLKLLEQAGRSAGSSASAIAHALADLRGAFHSSGLGGLHLYRGGSLRLAG